MDWFESDFTHLDEVRAHAMRERERKRLRRIKMLLIEAVGFAAIVGAMYGLLWLSANDWL